MSNDYQDLFNFMSQEHGLILTITQMDDIKHEVDKLNNSPVLGKICNIIEYYMMGRYNEEETLKEIIQELVGADKIKPYAK